MARADGSPPVHPAAGDTAPLCAAIARGDTAAFGRFYEAWFDRTYALARSISRRDESFCMDVTQEVMMRVAKGMRALSDEGAVAAWMGRTVFNTVADLHRRERRRGERERSVAERTPVMVEAPTPGEDRERIDWLREQLADLEPRERLLLIERIGHDRTLRELGEAIGSTGNAVHGKVRRVLMRLRDAARRWDHDQD